MAVDTMINTLVDGRYRVLRKLGTGGMANVYLAEDQELGRRVAIKVLDERHASDEQFVERFRREAKAAAALSHPNIVSIFDRGETDGTYYIAMEYLEGPTLKELIRQGTPSIRTAITYTRQILGALRMAHRRGLVHRDIKPHNVMIDAEGRPKVTDFGIARSGPSQMTEAGSIIGTAQYLSPEQARGAPVDQRSDLYSIGIVLYELLTGTVPFTGTTPLEIAMKHLSAIPEPPSMRRPDVPPDVDKVVLRALAKNPDERYQSAEEMDADLARIERGLAVSDETADAATAVLAGSGIEATAIRTAPAGTPPPASPYGPSSYYEYVPPVRRRPIWPWLLALVLLVGAGVGGWYAYDRIQDELAEAKPVTVPPVEGQVEFLARQNIVEAGLRPRIVRQFNVDYRQGVVFDQDPAAGEKIDRGNTVTLFVSRGKPRVDVPDLVGRTVDDARTLLQDQGLRANVFEVYSDQPVGTVVAQESAAGHQHRPGLHRPHQHLPGPEADRGTERHRAVVRERRRRAQRRGLPERPGRRRLGSAGGHGGRPGSGFRLAPAAGDEDHPRRLARPADDRGPGRRGARPGERGRVAAERRLRRRRPGGGHRGPGRGRHRAGAGPVRRGPGGTRRDGADHGGRAPDHGA